MKALIDDLLAYSRIGRVAENVRIVDLNAALQEAKENLQAAIGECNALIESEHLPNVNADSIQMLQLFQNLLGNAIKYRSDKRPKIQIKAKKKDENWLFSFQDNGIGINPQYSQRVFVIFQRLHSDREKYSGTGIGLAICKKIVERHGGKIWVESQLNQGATFFFTLPQGTIREPDNE